MGILAMVERKGKLGTVRNPTGYIMSEVGRRLPEAQAQLLKAKGKGKDGQAKGKKNGKGKVDAGSDWDEEEEGKQEEVEDLDAIRKAMEKQMQASEGGDDTDDPPAKRARVSQ